MKQLTGNFILMGILLCSLQAPAWATGVYVNGHHLSQQEVVDFNQAIDGRITPGKHWYDAASGFSVNCKEAFIVPRICRRKSMKETTNLCTRINHDS